MIPKIDINILALDLNAIDSARQVDMAGMPQQWAVGILPRGCKFVQELYRRFGSVGGNLDFALVICANCDGRLIVVLINGNDFVEINREERVLIQRHGVNLPKTNYLVHLLLFACAILTALCYGFSIANPCRAWFAACMRKLIQSGILTLIFSTAALGADAPANQLTPEEKAAGWTLLFDGKSTAGWHSHKKATFPQKGWQVEDGWLRCLGKGGGDVISDREFDDFELTWEWKQAVGGNSGLKYF